MLALFAAIFTVLERGREFLEDIFGAGLGYLILILLVALLLSQCLYSFTRILWYAQFSVEVLYAPERPLTKPKAPEGWPSERPWKPTPIFLLRKSAEILTRGKLAVLFGTFLGTYWGTYLANLMYRIGSDLRSWFVFTLVITTAIDVCVLLFLCFRFWSCLRLFDLQPFRVDCFEFG